MTPEIQEDTTMIPFDPANLETGLEIQDDIPEAEFLEIGRQLARMEKGIQWAIGDWYNAIHEVDANGKKISKQKVCESVGLNYETAQKYGSISKTYENRTRVRKISYNHFKEVGACSLSIEQKLSLLEQAEKNNWNRRKTVLERNKLLGKPEKFAVNDDCDPKVSEILKDLPKTKQDKIAKGIKKMLKEHDAEANKQADEEIRRRVQQIVEERVEPERESLRELRRETDRRREFLDKHIETIDQMFSYEEFQFIRNLLHPDRHQADGEEMLEKYRRAFQIFNRLKDNYPQKALSGGAGNNRSGTVRKYQ